MDIKKIKISSLVEYEKNYNKHSSKQIEHMKKSIRTFGQFKNIVVWNNKVLAGNGLIQAMKELSIKEVQVYDVTRISEQEAEKLLIADNALPYMSSPDTQELEKLLAGYDNPLEDLIGVDKDFLKSMKIFNKEEINFPDFTQEQEQHGFNSENDFDNPDDLGVFENVDQQNKNKMFALSIVVDEKIYGIWNQYKEKIGKSTDSRAFIKLLTGD